MGRGPGGRCATRRAGEGFKVRHGTPAFDVKSKEFSSVVEEFIERDLMNKWDNVKLGVLDGLDGKTTAIPTDEFHLYRIGTNFCRTLLEDANPYFKSAVRQISFSPPEQKSNGRWMLFDGEKKQLGADTYDWLIITSPVVAHQERWSSTFGGPAPLAEFMASLTESKDISETISTFDLNLARDVCAALTSLQSKPVLSLISVFPKASVVGQQLCNHYPFDQMHVSNSAIGKVARQIGDDYVSIVAHSTHDFAQEIGQLRASQSIVSTTSNSGASSQDRQQVITNQMQTNLVSCLDQWVPALAEVFSEPTGSPANLTYSAIHRWGSAFPHSHAYFSQQNTQLSHTMSTMGLVICGDFVTDAPGRVETAIMSGRHGAECLATSIQKDSTISSKV